jgi:hypothetical protein
MKIDHLATLIYVHVPTYVRNTHTVMRQIFCLNIIINVKNDFYFLKKCQTRDKCRRCIHNNCLRPGITVVILEIFSQRKIAKKLAFLTQNKAKLCKFLIVTLGLEKNAHFFAKN